MQLIMLNHRNILGILNQEGRCICPNKSGNQRTVDSNSHIPHKPQSQELVPNSNYVDILKIESHARCDNNKKKKTKGINFAYVLSYISFILH